MSRVARQDGEISGIAFKKGDLFALSLAGVSGLSPERALQR